MREGCIGVERGEVLRELGVRELGVVHVGRVGVLRPRVEGPVVRVSPVAIACSLLLCRHVLLCLCFRRSLCGVRVIHA